MSEGRWKSAVTDGMPCPKSSRTARYLGTPVVDSFLYLQSFSTADTCCTGPAVDGAGGPNLLVKSKILRTQYVQCLVF